MPLYEYECESCGHRFERIQKFSDALVETCPQCNGPVRKLLSSPAIQFKGSGWYITDYAKKSSESSKGETPNKGETPKSDSAAPASGSSTSSSTTDSSKSSSPKKE